jgi:hypothetical protein
MRNVAMHYPYISTDCQPDHAFSNLSVLGLTMCTGLVYVVSRALRVLAICCHSPLLRGRLQMGFSPAYPTRYSCSPSFSSFLFLHTYLLLPPHPSPVDLGRIEPKVPCPAPCGPLRGLGTSLTPSKLRIASNVRVSVFDDCRSGTRHLSPCPRSR